MGPLPARLLHAGPADVPTPLPTPPATSTPRCPQLAKDFHYGLPQMHVRTASTAEPAPYLADPVFSSCTVPIVYYAHYIGNPSHMFRCAC